MSIACSDWCLRPVAVDGTTGRANDRTIAELLVGSCISRATSRATSRTSVHVQSQ